MTTHTFITDCSALDSKYREVVPPDDHTHLYYGLFSVVFKVSGSCTPRWPHTPLLRTVQHWIQSIGKLYPKMTTHTFITDCSALDSKYREFVPPDDHTHLYYGLFSVGFKVSGSCTPRWPHTHLYYGLFSVGFKVSGSCTPRWPHTPILRTVQRWIQSIGKLYPQMTTHTPLLRTVQRWIQSIGKLYPQMTTHTFITDCSALDSKYREVEPPDDHTHLYYGLFSVVFKVSGSCTPRWPHTHLYYGLFSVGFKVSGSCTPRWPHTPLLRTVQRWIQSIGKLYPQMTTHTFNTDCSALDSKYREVVPPDDHTHLYYGLFSVGFKVSGSCTPSWWPHTPLLRTVQRWIQSIGKLYPQMTTHTFITDCSALYSKYREVVSPDDHTHLYNGLFSVGFKVSGSCTPRWPHTPLLRTVQRWIQSIGKLYPQMTTHTFITDCSALDSKYREVVHPDDHTHLYYLITDCSALDSKYREVVPPDDHTHLYYGLFSIGFKVSGSCTPRWPHTPLLRTVQRWIQSNGKLYPQMTTHTFITDCSALDLKYREVVPPDDHTHLYYGLFSVGFKVSGSCTPRWPHTPLLRTVHRWIQSIGKLYPQMTTHTFITDCSALDSKYREVVPPDDHTHLYYGLFSVGFKVSGSCTPRWPHTPLLRTVQRWIQSIGKLYPQMTTHTFITDCSALYSKYREVVPPDDHTHLYYGLFGVGFKVSGSCTPRWPHTPLLRTVQRWIQSIGKLYPQMTTHTFITDCSALDSKYREVVPPADDHTHLYYGLFSVGFKVSGSCTPRWPHTPLLRTVRRWIQSIGKLYPQMTTHTFITDCSALDSKYREVVPPDDHTHLYYGLFSVGFKVSGSCTPSWWPHTPLLRTVQRWIQSIGKLYPQMTTHTFITDCSALDSKYREVVPPDDHTHLYYGLFSVVFKVSGSCTPRWPHTPLLRTVRRWIQSIGKLYPQMTTHTFIMDCSALDSKYREVVPPDDHTHLYYGLFSVGFKVSGSCTPSWWPHTPLLRTVQRWIQSIGKLYPQMTTHTFITDCSALDSKYREVVPPDDHTHLYYGLFSVGFKVSGSCTPRWPHTPLLRTVQRWIQSIGKLYPQMTTHIFITDCSALDSKYREVVPQMTTHTFITDCSALDSKYREVVPPDDHTHLYYGLFSVGFKVSGSCTPRWPHTPLLRTFQRWIQSIGKLYPQMTTHTGRPVCRRNIAAVKSSMCWDSVCRHVARGEQGGLQPPPPPPRSKLVPLKKNTKNETPWPLATAGSTDLKHSRLSIKLLILLSVRSVAW